MMHIPASQGARVTGSNTGMYWGMKVVTPEGPIHPGIR
jgi:hypothetical protein